MWAQGRLGAFFCICLPRRAASSAECRMDVEGNHRGDHTNHDDTEHQCRAAGCISTHRSSLTHIYSVSRPQAENWELMRTRLVSSLSLFPFFFSLQFSFTFFSICWTSHFLQPPFSVSPRLDAHLFVGRRLYVSVHMLDDPNRTSRILLRCVCASRICLSLSIYACVCVCLN